MKTDELRSRSEFLHANIPQVSFCLVKHHANQVDRFSAVPILVGVAFGTNLFDGTDKSFLNRPVEGQKMTGSQAVADGDQLVFFHSLCDHLNMVGASSCILFVLWYFSDLSMFLQKNLPKETLLPELAQTTAILSIPSGFFGQLSRNFGLAPP